MRDIIEDIKIITIILIGSVIYSFIIWGKINLVEMINILLIVTFSICICAMIVSYKLDKKYLTNLYMYLSICFWGIGIVSISYNHIVNLGIYRSSFWSDVNNFNMAFSVFESIILLVGLINRNKTGNYSKFLVFVILFSLFTIYFGMNCKYYMVKLLGNNFYENNSRYLILLVTMLKFYVLYFVHSIKEEIPGKLYTSFMIFLWSRISLHILEIVNISDMTNVTFLLSCLILLIGNYAMAKMMIIDVIKIPRDNLYKDLAEKTKSLEDTVMKMEEISNEKDIICDNYNKKAKEEKIRNNVYINLSHEFKTPINVIYAAIQIQEMKNRNGKFQEAMQYNSTIKQNCNRLIRLINNFIDVTNLENNLFQTEFQYINIVDVTENIVVQVRKFAKSKEINIIFDTEEEELYAYVDKVLYRRALLNILSNSIKYTNIESDINVRVSVSDIYVCIDICDEGIGIEEDKLVSIFNRFERIDKTFSRDTEGCGLGLNLVKEIIRLFDGRLRICSAERVGTSIHIKIPKCDISSDEKSNIVYDINDKDNIKHEVEIEMSDIYFD